MTNAQQIHSSSIKIETAELRVVSLPLLEPFVISTGTMTDKVFPLLILRGEGLEGIAESVVDTTPDYLEEITSGSLTFTREVLLPMVLGKRFNTPYALDPLFRPWRGNYMAKASVEMAVWDMWAKSLNIPLKSALGGIRDAVDVGVSVGIMPLDATLAHVTTRLKQGYKRIKLKIMPGHDVKIVTAVRERFPDISLTVDANNAYTLADMKVLAQLDSLGLDYIEQPLAYDDIVDHGTLQQRLSTPICLDESIRTPADARKALQLDATRVVNIKVGRVGGYASARAIHDLCAAHNVPVWCGGMLEAGIGRAHNIHLATLENFCKPGDTASASRYFKRDIIEEKLEAVNGQMPVPAGPGIGVHLDWDFLDSVTLSKEEFSA